MIPSLSYIQGNSPVGHDGIPILDAPESGCTDLLPPVDDCRESLGLGTPDAVESGMEVAGGIPPAEIDISVNPDMLPKATSVTTEVSEEWMEIDTPDPVESGMEITVEALRLLVTLAWSQMCYRQRYL